MDQTINLSQLIEKTELPTREGPSASSAAGNWLVAPQAPPPVPEIKATLPSAANHPAQQWLEIPESDPDWDPAFPPEVRDYMIAWTLPWQQPLLSALPLGATGTAAASLNLPPGYSLYVPVFVEICQRIREELQLNLTTLLTLNPSRRNALLSALNRAAGSSPLQDLRRWIEGPRTPTQQQALDCFIEEVALFCLGQAVILKAWSDRKIRPWDLKDLGHLNWALSHALKPHIPPHREGWHLTRPNLYSWYHPSGDIQKEIWESFSPWNLSQEGPQLLAILLRLSRRYPQQSAEYRGYDPRFFVGLWECLSKNGMDLTKPHCQGPIRRKWLAFCPTLRDGTAARTAPLAVEFSGAESQPFLLLTAELVRLWWGPSAPPLWIQGHGLETQRPEQLSINWNSPKPSVESILTELESSDLALVLEEKPHRTSGRSAEIQEIKNFIDAHPLLKKARGPETSLGDLQALVSLGKLRPGGFLWWARETSLGPADGHDLLRALFERGRLIAEWDLSGLEHSLPVQAPIYPKFLYLFQRESDAESCRIHTPVKVKVRGQIRSHVEVPVLFGEMFSTGLRPNTPPNPSSTRSSWQIRGQKSANSQIEWLEHWPDERSPETWMHLEELQKNSLPLGQISIVRAASLKDPAVFASLSARNVHALYASVLVDEEVQGCRLRLQPVRTPLHPEDEALSEFLILFPAEGWIAPVKAWLESRSAHHWLDHFAEKRRGRWILKESVLKMLPIPKVLHAEIERVGDRPLPKELDENRLIAEFGAIGKPTDLQRARYLVVASRLHQGLIENQRRLFMMFNPDGSLNWRPLLDMMSEAERVPFALHPEVKITGNIPPHLPISRIQKAVHPQFGQQGFLLVTESGQHSMIASGDPFVLELLWGQLEGLTHPTWTELALFIHLPRDLLAARQKASDMTHKYEIEKTRLAKLAQLVSDCSLF